jgi:cysteine-rich repeat protein
MDCLIFRARAALGLGVALALGCAIDNPAFTVGPPTGGASETDATSSATTGDATADPTETTDQPGTTGTTDPAPYCGDGEIDAGETCDDGNATPADGCEPDCTPTPPPPTCGDGEVDDGEECDDANDSEHDACLSNCFAARCGDGIVHDGVEECDDGDAEDADDCLSTCLAARCGDGLVHAGVEECDDANDLDTDACTSTCAAAECGDGLVHQGVEECDDANDNDSDTCTNACTVNTCGDGEFQFASEQCDASAEMFLDLPPGVCAGCKLAGACFVRLNTAEVDFDESANEHYTWFDECRKAPGNKVHVLVASATKKLFYGSGNKTKMWTEAVLTSDAAPSDQWNVNKHAPIAMNNTDRLYLFAKTAKPLDPLDMNCNTRLGDGYGLAIVGAAKSAPKVLFMPYTGGGTDTPRTFPGWAPNRELSTTDGVTPICQKPGSLQPLLDYRIAIMVTP